MVAKLIGSSEVARECGSMKKPKTKATKSSLDIAKEIGQKYGVTVTDMSDRGVRAIGILGGVRRQDKGPRTPEPNTTKPATPLGE